MQIKLGYLPVTIPDDCTEEEIAGITEQVVMRVGEKAEQNPTYRPIRAEAERQGHGFNIGLLLRYTPTNA